MATKDSDGLRRKLRRLLQPLRNTPLHPQWLISRLGDSRTDWVATRAGGNVLDIGCADCAIRNALKLAENYFGLDYPATASALYGTRPDVYGNASALPFSAASFDTVLMLDVLEHVADPVAATREASRVLHSGGRLLLTIPFAYPLHDQPHDYQRLTYHGLVHMLTESGFTSITIHEASEGIVAAAGCLALALAQGAIDVITARSWRVIFVPIALLFIPLINLFGWSVSMCIPARKLMPAAYYVHADFRSNS